MMAGDPSGAGVSRRLSGVLVECVVGDIARQSGVDAVVNAANAELRIGGGVAGAIHTAAGPDLEQACRPLAPIQPGQAVITDAYGLPNRRVIHCLGPRYGIDEPVDQLLRACYRAALDLAEADQVGSIAFPAISTGAFGVPVSVAAPLAMDEVAGRVPSLAQVRRIRFVLFDRSALSTHAKALDAVAPA